jgi:ABC-2 type transport system permease protein
VLAATQAIADEVKQQLEHPIVAVDDDLDDKLPPKYSVKTTLDTSAASQKDLFQQVDRGELEGYIWLDDQAVRDRKLIYRTREASDFMQSVAIRNAVAAALMKQQLASHGIANDEIERLQKPLEVQTMRIDKGRETKSGGIGMVMLPFLLMMMIYITVIVYGVAVMRSVLEEKNSRVMEVMLSSVTARELMAGKILGVGSVGLTQILIWVGLGMVATTPAAIAAKPYLAQLQIPPAVFVCFPIFFLLGFILYSCMYAAVGAMVNSDEEAQQLQWPVILPIIGCTAFAMEAIRHPNSQLAFVLSEFPLTSPILMFVRVVVQQPPLWQILLSIGILLVTIYGAVVLCSRIYRVGILMYGKRPTLPKILKWIRYA